MDQTKLIFNNEQLEYERTKSRVIKKDGFITLMIIVIFIFFLSTSYSILLHFEWAPLLALERFKRIKKNMNSWATIINEKTGIENNKGRQLALTKKHVTEFQCIDFGLFYVPGRISPISYLPEFVRRGTSGPWIINKADYKDLSALQFCSYLLDKHVKRSTNLENLITCGNAMYEKLGFSGYFIPNSPCEMAIKQLIKK